MPAPKGNTYWKERKKHGRNKIFDDPEQVEQLANDYIQYCSDNPIIVEDFIKSGERAGEKVYVNRPRIPNQLGFTVFLGIDEKTLYNYLNDDSNKDLLQSFNHACEQFRSELTDNATTGQANPMIAARILGLKEKTDITSNDKEINIGKIEIVETPGTNPHPIS